jgi:aerobic-type carbon monoxide dehydrogenase small subunit (CoxS/CutS family)
MSNTIQLDVNGKKFNVDASPDRNLLAVLRNELDLTGTKYGCGEGQCGACTVLIGGIAMRSCIIPLRAAMERQIITIEGLEVDGRLHPLQETFIEECAMQCGYCTPGMIMSGAALLKKNSNPSQEEIIRFMQGNICRCGTYRRIVSAIGKAAKMLKENQK